MKRFRSIEAFTVYLYERTAALEEAEKSALKRIGEVVLKDAQAQIGNYQPEVGPFPEWRELKDSTKTDRVNQGFTENDPLDRTGAMRDSLEFTVERKSVVIGSADKVALYQEMGTEGPNAGPDGWHVPPRPFLGPALFKNESKAIKIIGEEIGGWLAGTRP